MCKPNMMHRVVGIDKVKVERGVDKVVEEVDISPGVGLQRGKMDAVVADKGLRGNSVVAGKQQHAVVAGKGFRCRHCPVDEFFTNMTLLMKHCRRFHSDKTPEEPPTDRFQCTACGNVYRDVDLAKRHMVNYHHFDYPSLTCSADRSKDGYFTVIVDDVSGDVNDCGVCQDVFASKSALEKHELSCKGKERTNSVSSFVLF